MSNFGLLASFQNSHLLLQRNGVSRAAMPLYPVSMDKPRLRDGCLRIARSQIKIVNVTIQKNCTERLSGENNLFLQYVGIGKLLHIVRTWNKKKIMEKYGLWILVLPAQGHWLCQNAYIAFSFAHGIFNWDHPCSLEQETLAKCNILECFTHSMPCGKGNSHQEKTNWRWETFTHNSLCAPIFLLINLLTSPPKEQCSLIEGYIPAETFNVMIQNANKAAFPLEGLIQAREWLDRSQPENKAWKACQAWIGKWNLKETEFEPKPG